MSIRSTIIAQIEIVARQQGVSLAPLSDSLPLFSTGLDSLCLAILIANLDDELGLDPLSNAEADQIPVTIGDLVRLFEDASAHAGV